MNPTAAIIVIGNEILAGKVPDSNAQFLLRELRELGIKLEAIFVIPDRIQVIADLIRRAEPQYDIIFTMGGIGPTHDDVTLQGIADGIGVRLIRNAEYERLIRQYHGDQTNAAVLKMADMPEQTELLPCGNVKIPVIKVRKFYIFPGEPELFKKQFSGIKERFRQAPFNSKNIYLSAGEEEIAAVLDQAQIEFSQIEIGSYPDFRNEEYKVKVVIDSKDSKLNQKAADYILERIPKKFVVRVD